MHREILNHNEVRILCHLGSQQRTLSEMADELGLSLTWTSRCVSHLCKMGFAERLKIGITSIIKIPSTLLGNSLLNLLLEESMINLESVIGNSGLKILPLILAPGMKAKVIVKRSNLSSRTVQAHLGRWRKMGLLVMRKRMYVIHPRHVHLIEFIRRHNENKNLRRLEEEVRGAYILWQDRDRFIFSTIQPLKKKRFLPAGYTRLSELGFDIVSRNTYYLYDTVKKAVGKEEATIQALLLDPGNPRIKKMILRALQDKSIQKEKLNEWAKKYDVVTLLKEMI